MLSTTIYSITMHVAKPIQTFRKSMGKRWKWLKRLLPNAQKIQSSRRKTKQFSSYFRFPTSHTTVHAVPHTAVPILGAIRDMSPLK